MRGFDYYTGIVFEVFDEAPENRRAMFGGGRYDGLVGLFGVEPLPVVGVAPGETTFREFLLAHNLMPDFSDSCGPNITILPIGGSDTLDAATDVADELRGSGLNVTVDYTGRKADKQTKAAVKNKAGWLIYIGDDELTDEIMTVKNVGTGKQDKVPAVELISYFYAKLDEQLDSLLMDKVSEEE